VFAGIRVEDFARPDVLPLGRFRIGGARDESLAGLIHAAQAVAQADDSLLLLELFLGLPSFDPVIGMDAD
jgi:hypothetical protein